MSFTLSSLLVRIQQGRWKKSTFSLRDKYMFLWLDSIRAHFYMGRGGRGWYHCDAHDLRYASRARVRVW